MYNLITVVVDKGLAEDVIDAANKAGAKVERSSMHVVREYTKVVRYFHGNRTGKGDRTYTIRK